MLNRAIVKFLLIFFVKKKLPWNYQTFQGKEIFCIRENYKLFAASLSPYLVDK